jgi:hypothetical protein
MRCFWHHNRGSAPKAHKARGLPSEVGNPAESRLTTEGSKIGMLACCTERPAYQPTTNP